MSSNRNHRVAARSSGSTNAHDTPMGRRKHGGDERDEMPPPAPVAGPLQSIEGWVVFVTGVHEESQEDDLADCFSEYGKVKSVHLNMDRKTGLVKGYALIEYNRQVEAQDAINSLHGTKFLGKPIGVHWAFCKSPTTTSCSVVEASRRRKRRTGRYHT
jgi:RNA-binding protein 8A